MRFLIPILCSTKLEAFINVVGKLKIEPWDSLERKLGFKEKLLVIAAITKIPFDEGSELTKSTLSIFEIRNALVHPKMKYQKLDEMITAEEYEKRSEGNFGVNHHLRAELTQDQVEKLIISTDEFVEYWGKRFLDHPDYWLRGGSTGGFSFDG